MPISFEEFKVSCINKGYAESKLKKHPNNFVLWSKNGTKCETKTNWYTIGYKRTAEELEVIRTEIESQGFSVKGKASDCINVHFNKVQDVLENFWTLVNIVENIDGLVEKTRGVATKVFSREVDEENKFEKIAGRYFYAIQNQDQELLDLARGLLSGDSIDRLISRGESVDCGSVDYWREHIVPCIMIHNKAIEMVLGGSTKTEVSQMVASNLAIVRITKAEAHKLDVELGLRTTMPAGWNWGDSIFARLDSAGIKLK